MSTANVPSTPSAWRLTEWRSIVSVPDAHGPAVYHFVQWSPTCALICNSTHEPSGVSAFQEGIASVKGAAEICGETASPTR